MDFGRVPENELNKVDFKLPPEPPINQTVLKGKKGKNPEVYIGCAKWGRKEWIGKIYPKGTKEKDFLELYGKHYNSIELNATHYKLYSPTDLQKWIEKVNDKDFKFSPKVYQGISHFGSLKDKKFLTDSFLESIVTFGEHLGPIFLQVSDKFGPKRKDELFEYLETLPKDVQFFLEVRHPDWFIKPTSEELFKKLKQLKIGAVITDTAGRRDCCHMHLTIPKAFIRYVGNSLHKTDYTRIDAWVDRMKYWLDNGIQQINFFMHMHDEATSPELTVYLVNRINKVCGLNLIPPKFLDDNLELF
ncbi:MAG TPA: DUF72 domain-containing protein [Flavisolibacter sp.]|jgi:uncharacterized protein YecE (DUF72 family)|nr:DUF72 domain-containing protein [Flavisolibacter sp.]